MTQEEKFLLLQELCARLPYGVKCHFKYGSAEDDVTLGCIDNNVARFEYGWYGRFHVNVDANYIKPYLRPMSSMTEEEKKEYDNFLFDNLEREDVIGYEDKAFGIDVIMRYRSWEVVQWLLEHHLDFNGLIDLGLALEAPNDMYKKGI